MTSSPFFLWGALAFIAVLLYKAWGEWRRMGRTRTVESLLVLALLFLGITLRQAPDPVRYTHLAVVGVVVVSQVWRDRKTFFRHDLMTWLLGVVVALIVILEIDHDVHPFLPHGAQRALLGLFAVATVIFISTPIVQLTRLTVEARRVIAEARAMMKTAAESRTDSRDRPV